MVQSYGVLRDKCFKFLSSRLCILIMKPFKRFLIVSIITLACIIAFWSLAISILPQIATNIFLYPSRALFFITIIIPDKIVYYLWPDGGLDAMAGLASMLSFMSWWIIGVLMYYFIFFIRGRRHGANGLRLLNQ